MNKVEEISWQDNPQFAIIYTASKSIFGGSRGQVALVLYELLNLLKIKVTFVHIDLIKDSESWWPDCYEPPNLKKISINEIIESNQLPPFDYVIDIDGLILHEIRQKIAKNTIVFYRKRFLINEIENSVYLQEPLPLNIVGASAVWMWKEFNENEIEMLSSVLDCPVFLLPYTWSSKPIDTNISKFPFPSPSPFPSQLYDFVLIDKNFDNQSNSIIPITTLYNFIKNEKIEDSNKISSITVFNGKNLTNSDYFETNVMKNTFGLIKSRHTLDFTDRQRIVDLYDVSNNLVTISHIRFQPFQPFMFDLAWLNIPFIHNSPFMANLHPYFQALYYPESSIESATEIIRNVLNNNVCSKPSIAEIQKIIYEKFSPQSNVVNFVSILKKTLASASPILTNIQAPTPTSATDSRSDISYNEQLLGSVKEYEVLFLDMYDGFEPDNNFFMDLFKANRFNVSVFQSNQDSKNLPDFIIHGSFNRRNENDFYPETIPRIFFSGECEQRYPINHQDRRIQLFLTFNLREDERYMRLPIWVLYLDWFNKIPVTTTTSTKSVDQYPRNPGIMPLTLATDSNPNPYISRKEFCSFIVSNPHCNTRNLFFKKLSTAYKKVNSAGKFLNNIGEPIGCLHEGGGQGDAAKHNYLTKHKFNICFENTCESGYITEKVLQAKLAGCVPLYWGEQNIAIDFDQQGIVNLSGKSLAEMIQTVKYLDEHPEEASKIARIPALSDELLCYWQNRLTKIASRIRTIVETSKSQEHMVQSQALAPVPALASPPKSLVFLTYLHESTKSSNINSLIFSVKYLEQIIPKNQDFQYAVYYHPDISQSILDLLISYSSKSQINIQLHKLNIHSTNPFPQYWNYNIYGWRCELLKQASINPSFKDKTVVFQTYECIWTHIPEFLSTILNQLENPIMFLRNTTVKNNTIAPANIRKHLQITAEELNSNIIDPDIIIFKAGSEWVQNFLNLASTYIHNEDVLLNNPDISLLNNEIITHKYDCIVWSVLVKRYVLPNIVLDDFVDLLSLRSTYKMAKPVYLHKGKFVDIHRIYPNIDCINIINLDRRKDRLNQFYENNPGLLGFVERVRAVDGKELKLDRQMVKLFRKNNFAWKKSVMGCALSHYNIWKQLVNEKSAKINNYLILEDDVRFINTYQQDMVNSLKNLPDDWDILYLGGVLPINRENYPHVLEKVTGNWFRIMPNPCFSGGGENIPIYHHCTYSYIINRKSAQKLIDIVDEHGIYTSLDHLLMGLSLNNGKIFVHYPSVTYSFQDEDEDYKTTEFDNFNRIVKYDSDIWNNTDSFTEKDIQDCLAGTSTPAPVQAPESVLNP